MPFLPRAVNIVAYARTPVGSFLGSLSKLSAARLCSITINHCLRVSGIPSNEIQRVILGHVLPAACGQAPARQAALMADLPVATDVFSVNKVCASGLKAVALGAESIALGVDDIVIVGGMESMSQAPYYLINPRQGKGFRLGDATLTDGLVFDGLTDPYSRSHMGKLADILAKELSIFRDAQDSYALESYRRTSEAWKAGLMADEVVTVRHREGSTKQTTILVERDEEIDKLEANKVPKLTPVFDKHGTITAANSSSLGDGAATLLLMSNEATKRLGVDPVARICSYADASLAPERFGLAPSQTATLSIKRAGDPRIDVHEINEAFSAVVLANMQALKLDPGRVNCHGGAVAIGHPLGMSGARILISLLSVLRAKQLSTGCASVCNGGGGSTSIVIEML